ncbi:hypothetical protein ACEQ8H_008571 [Pleosporales sp. CAS-2024a]
MQTPQCARSRRVADHTPQRRKVVDSTQLYCPQLFKVSPTFSTTASEDPFEADTVLRPQRGQALYQSLPSRSTSPSPSNSETSTSIFGDTTYDWTEPSTWPILHLPYNMTPGASVPTGIEEMMCHVHYKGAGALALHELLLQEMFEAESEQEKRQIEEAAYLSWPFNCTREGWKVCSGMTSLEILQWKEEMAALRRARKRRAQPDTLETYLERESLEYPSYDMNDKHAEATDVDEDVLDDEQE